MTTFLNFQASALQAPQYTVTLDNDEYNLLITWNLARQGYFLNLHDQNQNLILCRAVVGSPTPLALAPPPSAEHVASMTWTEDDGGRVYFVMDEPSPTVTLGSYINISGAHNDGTGGDGAVNGTFYVDQFTDPSNFAALLTAAPGVVGGISGDIIINTEANSLVWTRGTVVATTSAPHNYPLGTVVKLSIANAVPTGYNGTYFCAMSGPKEFRYSLAADPGGASTQAGTYSPDINLVDGYFYRSTLVYREAAQWFEVTP